MQTQSTDKVDQCQKQKVFIGIDTHLKSWKTSIMLENALFKTISMDPSAKGLNTYLRKNFPEAEYYSVYEAGFCGYSVHRELVSLGVNNIIVNAADVPTTDKDSKQKEDGREGYT